MTLAEHKITGTVEQEHYMNMRKCEHPWQIIKFKRTGNFSFHCPECRVTKSLDYAPSLTRRVFPDGVPVNQDTRPYPSDNMPSYWNKKEYNKEYIVHVPPQQFNHE